MDPRHPEQAISRMRELMKQYDRIEADMANATTSAKLAQLEREGGLVVQEICLVAPRMHEAMMQASRQRRHDLAHGVVDLGIRTKYEQPFEPVEKSAQSVTKQATEPTQSVKKPVAIEKLVETELDKEVNETLRPLEKPKKTTRKKKTTKKAEK